MKKMGLLCLMLGLMFITACGQKKNHDLKNNSGEEAQYKNVDWATSVDVIWPEHNEYVEIVHGKLQCHEGSDTLYSNNIQDAICNPSLSVGNLKSVTSYSYGYGIIVYLLTEDNKVYASKCFDQDADDSSCKFEQILKDSKIINMSKPMTNYRKAGLHVETFEESSSCRRCEEVYFLTSDNKLISSDGYTYEEENKDFSNVVCTGNMNNLCIYYNNEGNISYRLNNNLKKTIDYKKLTDGQGNAIRANIIYMYYGVVDGEKTDALIVSQNDNLYAFNIVENEISLKNIGKIKNINEINTNDSKKKVIVEFELTDNTKYSIFRDFDGIDAIKHLINTK